MNPVTRKSLEVRFKNPTFEIKTTLSSLSRISVLFGRNGCGKSLLLRAWRDSAPEDCHYVIPERTGEFRFEPGQLVEQGSAKERMSQTKGNFVTEYRQRVTTRLKAYFARRGAIKGVVTKGDPEELERLVNIVSPDFSVTLKGDDHGYDLVRLSNATSVGTAQQLSSGEAELFTLSLDVVTMAGLWDLSDTETRVMLIDEPDAHIHPDLQVRLADFLNQVSQKYNVQMVVATHSTTLLAALGHFGGIDTSVVYLNPNAAENVARAFDDVHRELATCLGGHVLMGPLFGAPLLIVEGDDDYRIWSQVPRHHNVSLSVLPAKGGSELKKYQRTLEQMFQSLLDDHSHPVGYALLDGDIAASEESQRCIPFLKLACRESENLFFTDEVLSDIKHTWAEAASKIEKLTSRDPARDALLKRATQWSRKDEDLKPVIEQVASILDPKNVSWSLRVGRCLGKKRPEGQLAEFLGAEVVETLWGKAEAIPPVASVEIVSAASSTGA